MVESRWVPTELLMNEEGAQRGHVTPRFILANSKKIVVGNGGWPSIVEITGTKA